MEGRREGRREGKRGLGSDGTVEAEELEEETVIKCKNRRPGE